MPFSPPDRSNRSTPLKTLIESVIGPAKLTGPAPVHTVHNRSSPQFVGASPTEAENFYAGLNPPDRSIQQRTVELVLDSVFGDVK
jgi:hypothetical protein